MVGVAAEYNSVRVNTLRRLARLEHPGSPEKSGGPFLQQHGELIEMIDDNDQSRPQVRDINNQPIATEVRYIPRAQKPQRLVRAQKKPVGPGTIIVGLVAAVFIYLCFSTVPPVATPPVQVATAAEEAPAAISDAKKKELQAEFKANRKLIVGTMKKMMTKEDYLPARAWADTYKDADIQDTEFQTLYAAAKEGEVAKQAGINVRIQTLQSMNVDAEKINAGLFCKKLIKPSLKAPSTAKFPFFSDVTTNSGNLVFMVNSYVDAQNGFGAMIRTQYHCRLKYNGGGSSGWLVDDIGTAEQ